MPAHRRVPTSVISNLSAVSHSLIISLKRGGIPMSSKKVEALGLLVAALMLLVATLLAFIL